MLYWQSLKKENDKKHEKSKTSKAGFFLAELIVAVSIFGVVMVVSVGALVLALDANRKTQSLKSVLNNLNIALDSMTRTIATGSHYYCGEPSSFDPTMPEVSDCSYVNPDNPIDYRGITVLSNYDLNKDGDYDDFVTYSFATDPSDPEKGYISRTIRSNDGNQVSESVRMTAPEVDIDELGFATTGTGTIEAGEYNQPKVLVIISGKVPSGPRGNPTEFMIQTSVTQRVPDFQ